MTTKLTTKLSHHEAAAMNAVGQAPLAKGLRLWQVPLPDELAPPAPPPRAGRSVSLRHYFEAPPTADTKGPRRPG